MPSALSSLLLGGGILIDLDSFRSMISRLSISPGFFIHVYAFAAFSFKTKSSFIVLGLYLALSATMDFNSN
jgi:hypothetical protein